MSDIHNIHKAILLCNEEGCDQPGNCPCWLPDSDWQGESDNDYCWEHARSNGFCPSCGMFWAGIESFDFKLNGTSVCDNCKDAGDYGDDEIDGDDLDFGWGYPEWSDLVEGEEGSRYIGPGSETLGEHPEDVE